MRTRWLTPYTRAAGLLLIGFATAHLVGNQGGITLQPADPIFQVSSRYLFWGLGASELVVGLVCLFASDLMLANALALWLTSVLVIYRLGLLVCGMNTLRAYYQTMGHQFGISAGALNLLFGLAVGSLWCGSAFGVGWAWEERKERLRSLKMTCPACGVHIAFDARDAGQKSPCPKCRAAVTLRKPDLLKMACFFCKKHIEFPSHAIGEKIRCPHCNMDITLKEPA